MAAPVTMKENQNGFPIEVSGVMLKKAPLLPLDNVYCMRIPSWIFLPNATGFYDVDPTCNRGLLMIALFQFWMFIGFVATLRICKQTVSMRNYPFQFFLEMLRNSKGEPTNNMRLWIVEDPDNKNSTSLSALFLNAVNTNKKVDGQGAFCEFSAAKDWKDSSTSKKGKSSSKTVTGGAVDSGDGGGGMGGGGYEDFSSNGSSFEFYKKINNMHALTLALDTYLNQTTFHSNLETTINPGVLSPDVVFTIDHAFDLANKRDIDEDPKNHTLLDINVAQLDPANYIKKGSGKSGKSMLTLPFFEDVYHFIPAILDKGPSYIMSRMFPWKQINPNHDKWSAYVLKMIRKSKKASEDSNNNNNGQFQLPSARQNEDIPRVSLNGNLLDMFARKPTPLSNDQAERFVGLLKMTPVEIKDPALDDFPAQLSKFYKNQKMLIRSEYKDNPQEMHAILKRLRVIIYEKFATHCMGTTSDVSISQRTHNAYFARNDLGNKHWRLPMPDPKLSVVENAIIWLTEGFGWKDSVATAQFLCFFSYIGAGDRWRRMFDLHLNFLYSGSNGQGKSMIMETVQRNILEQTTTMLNTKSDKADAINDVSSDNFLISDDANLATYFSAVGKDCDAKSHLTTMKTTRAILDLVQEMDSDGCKKTVRKQTKLTNIDIRCLMMASNETLTDIEKNSNGFYQSAKALYNRFLSIDVPCYDNRLRSVSSSIAASATMTAEDRSSQDEFHDLNIKFDCIRGWAHKLMSIDEDIFNVNMRVFDFVWGFLVEELKKLGIESDHPRVAIQAKLWCRQLVIFEAYLKAHCLESSPFYGKTFNISMLADWVPVCMEHHVFLTLSAFYRFFVPPAMETVLDILHTLMEDSFKRRDDCVVFDGKSRYAYEKKKKDEQRARDEQAINIASAAINRATKRTPAAGAAGEDDADDIGGDVEKDAIGKAKEGEEGEEGEKDKPDIEGNYVRFGYTFDEVADLALMYMKKGRSYMQPGRSAIISVLNRLCNTSIDSRRYVFDSLDQTIPTLDDKSPETMNVAISRHSKGSKFLVHYGILVKNGTFRDALRHVIRQYCHKNTIERKILLAIENPRYPWLLSSMTLRPTNREIQISNPAFVFDSTISAMNETDRREHELSVYSRPLNWTFDKVDMDTMALQDFFKEDIVNTHMSVDNIRIHHPIAVLTEALKKSDGKQRRKIYDYPGDWINEYAIVEAARELERGVQSKNVEFLENGDVCLTVDCDDDDDDNDGAGGEKQKKIIVPYFGTGKVERFASFGRTIIPEDAVDKAGNKINDAFEAMFAETKAWTSKPEYKNIYKRPAGDSDYDPTVTKKQHEEFVKNRQAAAKSIDELINQFPEFNPVMEEEEPDYAEILRKRKRRSVLQKADDGDLEKEEEVDPDDHEDYDADLDPDHDEYSHLPLLYQQQLRKQGLSAEQQEERSRAALQRAIDSADKERSAAAQEFFDIINMV